MKHIALVDGDIIDKDTEFEAEPGKWERVGDNKAVSSRWMIGAKYSSKFFVPARRKDEQADRIAELEAFVRDCRDNWDCDEDAHHHGTTCRACSAGLLIPAEAPDGKATP